MAIKAGVRQREGWAMKERIRDKVRPMVLVGCGWHGRVGG